MTKELKRLSALMLLMFLVLFGSTSWIQALNVEALQSHPDNDRTLYDSYEIQRGPIVVDGSFVAYSRPSDDIFSFQRVYPDPQLWSQVTGYFNPALRTTAGIERELNSDLAGTGSSAFFATIERIISGQPQRGANAMLTLSEAGQRAAYEALDGLKGAVFAIEPATGRVLVMASTPGFDVNILASHEPGVAQEYYDSLVNDPDRPLYNRAIAGDLNPPGSTFKIVVAAAAFETGRFTPESEFPNEDSYQLPGTSTTIHNQWRGTCGPGETATIATAMRMSCNTIFAQLSVAVGEAALFEMAEKLGFNHSFEMPLLALPSEFPAGMTPDRIALASFGQGDVRATPLQMALVSGAIANGGIMMNPRMIDSLLANDLSVLRSYSDTEFGRVMSPQTASMLRVMMVDAVANGTGQSARIDGIDVAGKTGTAQNGETQPYSLWFTAFAPAENAQIAIAVVVEDGGGKGQSGSGGSIAAPIAKKVIEAVLNQ
jgi:peptidoglycan glycosyltransferase